MDAAAIAAVIIVFAAFVYAFVRRAPISLTIAIACLVVFALLAVISKSYGRPELSQGYFDLVLETGGWRVRDIPAFLTTMFVHQNMLHIGFNMAALIFLGAALEDRIGTAAFAVIFVVGGIVGNLVFYLIHYADSIFILGASGAISAELGAYARLYPRERVSLFFPGVAMPAIPAIWLAIGFLLASSVLVYVIPGVAHEAHMGGLVAGMFMAPAATRLSSKKKETVAEGIDLLEPLAQTGELRDILAKIKAEKIPDVREAWIGRFMERARCPQCGGPIMRRLGSLVSDCGWKMRLR